MKTTKISVGPRQERKENHCLEDSNDINNVIDASDVGNLTQIINYKGDNHTCSTIKRNDMDSETL